MTKTLILGRTGQLGWALARSAPADADVVELGRTDVDFADARAVEAAVDSVRPAVVLNAVAYTAVDRAEQDRDAAYAVNAASPAALAAACARHGAVLVHYSTDYVFDGRADRAYRETDPTGPLGVYGASKLAGEQAVLATPAAAIVLRTSWVYGEHGGNFLKTMLRLASERDALRVVADQRGAPTWTHRLAQATWHVVGAAVASGDAPGWLGERRGVYHAAAAGATTWADYARRAIAAAATVPAYAARLRVRPEQVESIPSSAYPTPAARPANSLLDSGRFARTFGHALPDWAADVDEVARRVAAAA